MRFLRKTLVLGVIGRKSTYFVATALPPATTIMGFKAVSVLDWLQSNFNLIISNNINVEMDLL